MMAATSFQTLLRLALLTGVCLPVPALAQTPTELESIEVQGVFDDGQGPFEGYAAEASVSATKGGRPIIETPQAVSVVGADFIADTAARTVTEATRYSPGIRSETFGNDARNDWFLLRGFTSQVSSYFVDGLALKSSDSFATWKMNPYLLERIDVLRGPSSSLYCSSNPCGLINMVTKRPTGETGGEITTGINEHGRGIFGIDAQGVAGRSGDWAWRFVASGNAGDTEYDFIDDDGFAIMPSLTWTPSEDTTLELYANVQAFSTNGQNFLPYVGTEVDAPFGRIDPETFTSEPGYDAFKRTQAMAGYEFEHRFNDRITVRQNLRYAHLDIDFTNVYGVGYAAGSPTATNADLARFNFITTPQLGLFSVDNQAEFLADTGALSHTLLFGVDYARFDLDDEAGFDFAPSLDLLNPVYSGITAPTTRYSDQSTVQQQLGLYVQDQIEYGNWDLVLSGRSDFVDTDIDNNLGADSSQSSETLSGRAGLMYGFDNGISPYVSVSRSFLPVIGTDSVSGAAFDPETGIQYEAGVKYQPAFLGGGYIGLSVFDLTRENVVTSDGINFNRQIGAVNSQGFELEAAGQITPDLKFVGSYTWYDLTIEEGNPVEIGNVPTAAPEQFASLWLDYTVPQGALEGVSVGGGVRYVGRSYADTANTLEVGDTVLVDAALRYEKDAFAAALNVSNLFDETYVAGCSSPTACFYGEGREVGLTLSYRW